MFRTHRVHRAVVPKAPRRLAVMAAVEEQYLGAAALRDGLSDSAQREARRDGGVEGADGIHDGVGAAEGGEGDGVGGKLHLMLAVRALVREVEHPADRGLQRRVVACTRCAA